MDPPPLDLFCPRRRPPASVAKIPRLPDPLEPPTDAARLYLAGLLLAIGAVNRCEALLAKSDFNAPPARALRTVIEAVQPPVGTRSTASHISQSKAEKITDAVERVTTSASESLALSYTHQSRHDLKAALAAAREALGTANPFSQPSTHNAQPSSNGFAWARVAELEFSFGHTRAAKQAVERALEFSPRNAQAHAVHGFLLAAEYKFHDALAAFDRAIEIDPALGNAWLGRGLVKRRSAAVPSRSGSVWTTAFDSSGPSLPNERAAAGDSRAPDWHSDLQTAAALEPSRSLVRSYAGKAFAEMGDARLALKELDYAARLDPNDPTPPLYKALELHQQNRPNAAVRELERSIALNDHRAVYHSRLPLSRWSRPLAVQLPFNIHRNVHPSTHAPLRSAPPRLCVFALKLECMFAAKSPTDQARVARKSHCLAPGFRQAWIRAV